MGTLKARIPVSGAWVPILGSGLDAANTARWNTAWGRVGYAQITSTVTGIQTTVVKIVEILYTMTAGRRYRISANGFATKAAPDTTTTVSAQLRVDVTAWQQHNFLCNAPGDAEFNLSFDMDAIGGQHSFNLAMGTSAGYVNVTAGSAYPCIITIDDIGPTTPASIAPPTAGPQVVASGNALGVIAVGSFSAATFTLAASTETQITNNLSVTLNTGRRYRVVLRARALIAAGATAGMVNIYLRNGTTNLFAASCFNSVPPNTAGYGPLFYDWLIDGDGATKSLNVTLNPTQSTSLWTEYQPYFYVEDVGPNTYPALPIPATPPAWTPFTPVNGWQAYGGGELTPGYRKIGDVVSVRGAIKNATPMTNPSLSQFFTLPVGFRSPYTQGPFCTCAGSDGYPAPNALSIDTGGVCSVVRSAQGPSQPHVITKFEFSFSVTP